MVSSARCGIGRVDRVIAHEEVIRGARIHLRSVFGLKLLPTRTLHKRTPRDAADDDADDDAMAGDVDAGAGEEEEEEPTEI